VSTTLRSIALRALRLGERKLAGRDPIRSI
jgi:hypothetical protein